MGDLYKQLAGAELQHVFSYSAGIYPHVPVEGPLEPHANLASCHTVSDNACE